MAVKGPVLPLIQVGPWLGLLACGVLVFAISPLQRPADRMSNAAMPQVNATSGYLTFRKPEVHKAAVESAHGSGEIPEAAA